MSTKSVFYFPLLLPQSGLTQDETRIVWTQSEDNLLAYAIRESVSLAKKDTLVELSFALQKRFMRAKTAVQIQARIKNLKLRDKESQANPVVKFLNSGVYQPRELEHTWSEVGNGSKSLMEMFVSGSCKDFSHTWFRIMTDIVLKKNKRVITTVPARSAPVLPAGSCALQASQYESPVGRTSILCVDGNTATPGSEEGADKEQKSPIKKLILSTSQFNKSPLKVASDRIIKKYSIISPHKRTGAAILKSPLKKPDPRRKCFLQTSPKPLTPSRTSSLTSTPPATYSPKSPCLPSPGQEDEVMQEADTPTQGKRKRKHQREAELTLALVGDLESGEEKEAREARECNEIFQEIMRLVEDTPDKKLRFIEIMSRAGREGTVKTYRELSQLTQSSPRVQEMLLDLLSESEAAEVSREVYWQHHQRHNMKNFILKLNIAYRHQPAFHARVLRELDTLCSDSGLTSDKLKTVATKLFKHNQHLLDHFMMLVPGVEPPESMLPSPEVVHFSVF